MISVSIALPVEYSDGAWQRHTHGYVPTLNQSSVEDNAQGLMRGMLTMFMAIRSITVGLRGDAIWWRTHQADLRKSQCFAGKSPGFDRAGRIISPGSEPSRISTRLITLERADLSGISPSEDTLNGLRALPRKRRQIRTYRRKLVPLSPPTKLDVFV